MTLRNFSIAIAAAAIAASAIPAVAQDTMSGSSSRVVTYQDLDLSSEMGRKRLDTRVRSAASSACGYRQTHSLAEKVAADRCLKGAIANSEPMVEAAARKAMRRK